MTGWHYRSEDGSEHGPLNDIEINNLAEAGALLLGTPVAHDEATHGEWVPAARVRELQDRIPETADYFEPESPFLLLLDWFSTMFSTPAGPVLAIVAFLTFAMVLLWSGSGIIGGIRASGAADSTSARTVQPEQKIEEGQEEQVDLPSETLARSQKILDKFEVKFVKYSYSDAFYRNRIMELHITNNTKFAISRAYFKGRVVGKGRTIPYVDDTIDYRISGGLEPGESAEWTITLNRYSDWAKIPDGDSIELITTVVPCRLEGSGGSPIADNQP